MTASREQCVSCLGPGPLLDMAHLPGNVETLCPTCAARQALSEAAGANLHALLWPVVVRWVKFWAAAGVQPDALQAELWVYGTYWHHEGALGRPGGEQAAISDALTEGEPAREEVQPFRLAA